MTDLAARNEVMLLAGELGAAEDRLAYLISSPVEELRAFRTLVSTQLFAKQEHRFGRVAGLTKLVPAALSAKIAEHALGPVVSGRVAGLLEPDAAVNLAKNLSPRFLAALSPSLDPQRVEAIVQRLPHRLTVEVGTLLLKARQFLVLGRFVSVAPIEVVMGVVDVASPQEILDVALYSEDKTSLNAVVEHAPAAVMKAVVQTAVASDAFDDALTILEYLRPENRAVLVEHGAALAAEDRNALVSRVAELGAWDEIITAFPYLTHDAIAALVNVPVVREPGVLDTVLERSYAAGDPRTVVPAVLGFDAATLEVAKTTRLVSPDYRAWLETAASDRLDEVRRVLDTLA